MLNHLSNQALSETFQKVGVNNLHFNAKKRVRHFSQIWSNPKSDF